MGDVRLIIEFNPDGLPPRELREVFIEALRDELAAEYFADRIDQSVSEELVRALPERGRA